MRMYSMRASRVVWGSQCPVTLTAMLDEGFSAAYV